MRIFIFLFLLLSIPFTHAFAQDLTDSMKMEQLIPNGEINVQLFWPEVLPEDLYNIEVRFLDPQTNELIIEDKWVVYSVIVIQQNNIIEKFDDLLVKDGIDTFEVVFPEEGTGSAEVRITVTEIIEKSIPIILEGQEVFFTVQVIPEFSTMAVIVLSTAFVLLVIFSRFRTISSFKIQIKN